MTDFLGEEYVVTHIAFGYNDEVLTDTDVLNVTITIFEPLGVGETVPVKTIDEQDMVWNPTTKWRVKIKSAVTGLKITKSGTGLWEYAWDTGDLTKSGTYLGRVTVHGVTGGTSQEQKRFRLSADRLPA